MSAIDPAVSPLFAAAPTEAPSDEAQLAAVDVVLARETAGKSPAEKPLGNAIPPGEAPANAPPPQEKPAPGVAAFDFEAARERYKATPDAQAKKRRPKGAPLYTPAELRFLNREPKDAGEKKERKKLQDRKSDWAKECAEADRDAWNLERRAKTAEAAAAGALGDVTAATGREPWRLVNCGMKLSGGLVQLAGWAVRSATIQALGKGVRTHLILGEKSLDKLAPGTRTLMRWVPGFGAFCMAFRAEVFELVFDAADEYRPGVLQVALDVREARKTIDIPPEDVKATSKPDDPNAMTPEQAALAAAASSWGAP